MSWWDEADGSGFWAVTRYRDCLEVSRNVETFTSTEGIRLEEMDDEQIEARRTLMELDPPDHTRLRRLVNKGFTRRTVETFEESIRELVISVLDRALTNDRFDFVHDVSEELPMRMLGRLLGTSDDDGRQLVAWGDAMLGNTDPEFTDLPGRPRRHRAVPHGAVPQPGGHRGLPVRPAHGGRTPGRPPRRHRHQADLARPPTASR